MSTYPVAYVGLPITANFYNSGQENVTVKGSDTSRVNNTLADDPELSGIALPVGQILVKVRHLYRLASAPANNSSVQYRANWAFTGTVSGTKMGDGPSADSGETNAATNSRAKKISGAYNTAQGYGAYNTFGHLLEEEGILNVTVAGNFSIQWAQNTTTAGNALTLGSNSFVTWRQIG